MRKGQYVVMVVHGKGDHASIERVASAVRVHRKTNDGLVTLEGRALRFNFDGSECYSDRSRFQHLLYPLRSSKHLVAGFGLGIPVAMPSGRAPRGFVRNRR